MPRSSTSVMGLDDYKDRQELRPRGPSSMLPLGSVIKDAFDKFEHDFQQLIFLRVNTSNLLLPLQSGTRWDSPVMRRVEYRFCKICITPKPPGASMGKVPLPILKELEHQARQNISTLNFTAAFAKTSSSCDASLEKCQHSITSTFKKVKTPERCQS